MLVETFGGLAWARAGVEELRKGAEWRANKLTASETSTTRRRGRRGRGWRSRRSASRLGDGAVLGRAQEVAEALGLSVAADPRVPLAGVSGTVPGSCIVVFHHQRPTRGAA